MFDGCLFVVTVGTSCLKFEPASICQCGLIDQLSIVSNSGNEKSDETDMSENLKSGLGLGNPMPKITIATSI